MDQSQKCRDDFAHFLLVASPCFSSLIGQAPVDISCLIVDKSSLSDCMSTHEIKCLNSAA